VEINLICRYLNNCIPFSTFENYLEREIKIGWSMVPLGAVIAVSEIV